jgi:hypothetical protein
MKQTRHGDIMDTSRLDPRLAGTGIIDSDGVAAARIDPRNKPREAGPLSSGLHSLIDDLDAIAGRRDIPEKEKDELAERRWQEFIRTMDRQLEQGKLGPLDQLHYESLKKNHEHHVALKDEKHPRHADAKQARDDFKAFVESDANGQLKDNEFFQQFKAERKRLKERLEAIPKDGSPESHAARRQAVMESLQRVEEMAANLPEDARRALEVMSAHPAARQMGIPSPREIDTAVEAQVRGDMERVGVDPRIADVLRERGVDPHMLAGNMRPVNPTLGNADASDKAPDMGGRATVPGRSAGRLL